MVQVIAVFLLDDPTSPEIDEGMYGELILFKLPPVLGLIKHGKCQNSASVMLQTSSTVEQLLPAVRF